MIPYTPSYTRPISSRFNLNPRHSHLFPDITTHYQTSLVPQITASALDIDAPFFRAITWVHAQVLKVHCHCLHARCLSK